MIFSLIIILTFTFPLSRSIIYLAGHCFSFLRIIFWFCITKLLRKKLQSEKLRFICYAINDCKFHNAKSSYDLGRIVYLVSRFCFKTETIRVQIHSLTVIRSNIKSITIETKYVKASERVQVPSCRPICC